MLMRQFAAGDVLVDADVVGQRAFFIEDLGDGKLTPVRLEVLASGAELALPAVAVGKYRRGVEQQLAEVFQSLQIGQTLTAYLG